MRVAFVSPALGFSGGLERFVFDRARALRARGHEVWLAHGGERGRDATAYAQAFDAVTEAGRGLPVAMDCALVQRARSVEELAWLGETPTLVWAHDHDATCVRSHRYVPLGREPCHRAPGVACVLEGCVIVRDRRPESRFGLRVVDPFALRNDTRKLSERYVIVACSGYVRDSLVSAGAASSRVVVSHPVPPSSEHDARERERDPVLLVIGSLLRGKGVDIAIDALAWLPSNVRLRVLGDGPERAALEAHAARVAPGRVEWMGAVHPDSVAREIDRCWAVLVPSRWPEPFGMTGIEAMRRGRPVVGARHGGIVEWLADERGAVGFDPGDPRSLAFEVKRVLADGQLGGRARAWAQSRWSFQRSIDELETIVREVSKEKHGGLR
ncbi:MAG: glycosyltransferase family 4 protein [Myxococcales bacterium]|nr:glycosyltransferase family 4 protein [Myxococcales bacterium]